MRRLYENNFVSIIIRWYYNIRSCRAMNNVSNDNLERAEKKWDNSVGPNSSIFFILWIFVFFSPAAILGYGSYPPNRAKNNSQSTDIAGLVTQVAKYRISNNSSFFFPSVANLGYGSHPPNRAKRIPQSTDIADFATRVAKYCISDNSQTLRFHDTYWIWSMHANRSSSFCWLDLGTTFVKREFSLELSSTI